MDAPGLLRRLLGRETWTSSRGEVLRLQRRHTRALQGRTAHYEVWSAPSKAAAQEYLNTRTVSRQLYYVVVESPQGNWGKDCAGVYKEDS